MSGTRPALLEGMSNYCTTAGHTLSTTETILGAVHQVCTMCGHERSHDEIVERAIDQLSYPCDGPVTTFVAIARAMRAVAAGTHPTVMANALAIFLDAEN